MKAEQKKDILKLIRKATKYKLGYKQIKNAQLQEVVEYCNDNKPDDLPKISIPKLEDNFKISFQEMINILMSFYEVTIISERHKYND